MTENNIRIILFERIKEKITLDYNNDGKHTLTFWQKESKTSWKGHNIDIKPYELKSIEYKLNNYLRLVNGLR